MEHDPRARDVLAQLFRQRHDNFPTALAMDVLDYLNDADADPPLVVVDAAKVTALEAEVEAIRADLERQGLVAESDVIVCVDGRLHCSTLARERNEAMDRAERAEALVAGADVSRERMRAALADRTRERDEARAAVERLTTLLVQERVGAWVRQRGDATPGEVEVAAKSREIRAALAGDTAARAEDAADLAAARAAMADPDPYRVPLADVGRRLGLRGEDVREEADRGNRCLASVGTGPHRPGRPPAVPRWCQLPGGHEGEHHDHYGPLPPSAEEADRG
jgi:hypothetical protein